MGGGAVAQGSFDAERCKLYTGRVTPAGGSVPKLTSGSMRGQASLRLDCKLQRSPVCCWQPWWQTSACVT